MNPLVSIVVPIYNVEEFLPRCVDSLLVQTYENVEIILVDDGSPDKCPQICDDYNAKYDNINVVHKKNGGLSSARNAGMEKATGKYLFFIDSDDWLDLDCIENLVDIAERENVDFVRTRGKYANWPDYEDGTVCDFGIEKMMVEGIYNRQKIESDILPICIATRQITFGPIVSAWGNLYRLDILKDNHIRFYEDIKYSEDAIFNVHILLCSHSLYYLSSRQYLNYYFNDKSITKSYRDDRWASNIRQIGHFENDFRNIKKYDFQNQLWLKKIFLILNALSERKFMNDNRQKIDYCMDILGNPVTIETMKHIDLVDVPWKLYAILLIIKYKQGWLLAKI